jgi:hypothetical protein
MTHDQVVSEIQARAAGRMILSHYCGPSLRCQGDRGMPDLVLIGMFGAGWIEVKMPGDSREPDQTTWYHRMRAAGQLYETMGPADLAEGGAVDLFLTFLSEG